MHGGCEGVLTGVLQVGLLVVVVCTNCSASPTSNESLISRSALYSH